MGIVNVTQNVGGATTSRWPAARAASTSRHTEAPSPMARANSRIFSRLTRYGGEGGSAFPTKEASGTSRCVVCSLRKLRSARLAVVAVHAAVRAELLQRESVGVVAPVLLRDVVPVLAHLAR